MKRVLIVYDSQFGNTERVALAMVEGLGSHAVVEARRVDEVSPQEARSADVLVVGSPTQGFRPTRAVQDWLRRLGSGSLQGKRAAAFDTRIVLTKFRSGALRWMIDAGGYAAAKMGNDLRRAGGILALRPEGFYVEDTEGPVRAGELERAAAWARDLLHAD